MKFYAACLLLGLEHMHDKSMIHRDLKPEKLLLDDKGMFIYIYCSCCYSYRDICYVRRLCEVLCGVFVAWVGAYA